MHLENFPAAKIDIPPLLFVAVKVMAEHEEQIMIECTGGGYPDVAVKILARRLVPGREVSVQGCPYEITYSPPAPIQVVYLGRGTLKIDLLAQTIEIMFFSKKAVDMSMQPIAAILQNQFPKFTIIARKP